MRVLVMEDQPGPAQVLIDYLIELGHHPIVVPSAEAALGCLHSARPDVIVLDIKLPGMSGIDFLRLKRVRDLGVPVVAVSGTVDEGEARECLRLGALDVIGKPVGLDRLADVLDCVAPDALARRASDAARPERRRSPRAELSFTVRVRDDGGEWEATATTLSAYAITLRPGDHLHGRKAVTLAFTPPDGREAITVLSVLMRDAPEGATYFFVDLGAAEVQRLRKLIAVRLGA
jgi:DNA-binding response OmpR family regulator